MLTAQKPGSGDEPWLAQHYEQGLQALYVFKGGMCPSGFQDLLRSNAHKQGRHLCTRVRCLYALHQHPTPRRQPAAGSDRAPTTKMTKQPPPHCPTGHQVGVCQHVCTVPGLNIHIHMPMQQCFSNIPPTPPPTCSLITPARPPSCRPSTRATCPARCPPAARGVWRLQPSAARSPLPQSPP